MKRIFSLVIIFISFLSYSEKISNYYVEVSLNKDKSVHIEEQILYNPEDKLVHGLLRQIVKDNVGNVFSLNSKLGIKNFKSNLNVSKNSRLKYDIYRLGDEDKYLEQNKEILIKNSYDIYNIIRTDADTTQIFLNVIGQYWDMPIEKAEIKLDFSNIKDLFVFTGAFREQTNNFVINSNIIETKHELKPYEGLTFKMNLDKKIYPYTTKDKLFNFLKSSETLAFNLAIIFVLLLLFFYLLYRKNRLTDKRPIEPVYKVDKKISPALAYMVYQNNIKKYKARYTILTVIFYSLLSKGLILSKDRYEDQEYVLKKGEKLKERDRDIEDWSYENDRIYYFTDVKKIEEALESKDILAPEEKKVVNNLFKKKDDILSNPKILFDANRQATNYVSNIYATNVGTINYISFVFISILLIISVVACFATNEFNISFVVVIFIALIDYFLNFSFMKLTNVGKDIVRNIKGFVLYFNLAEENIFKSFNTEQEIIDYAKEMLPYAIAVGIRKKFISKLDETILEKNLDRTIIYSGMYYGYLYNFDNINMNISSSNINYENGNFSGGNFSSGSGGFSGGGFSGGGGSSW
ncbi:DUF2207 domain-containing protein [Sneathia sanguinegens]|uniref:DUF2207 domain-containing protein n=1 Tax=Sneathia sanguinegens TaxID=40543 RepID=UPI00258836AD|nr:DUF2207 domain-containing protein [Sneathia sanguinegens]MDU4652576.1 DUF2207 domain-containing protein [Sneathia sanguinegens]